MSLENHIDIYAPCVPAQTLIKSFLNFMHCDHLASFRLFLKLCEDFSFLAFAQVSVITAIFLLGKFLKPLISILFANLPYPLYMITCNLCDLLIGHPFIPIFQNTKSAVYQFIPVFLYRRYYSLIFFCAYNVLLHFLSPKYIIAHILFKFNVFNTN